MKIPKRIARTVIGSLKSGVVPRLGLPYITVGRKNEIDALLHDVSVIEDGGASFRFIVGRYGSGKSFLLQTIRNFVLEKNFVVVDGDLSPERRLTGTRGQGLATYRELVRNMSTRTKPEGGALPLILDRWINRIQQDVQMQKSLAPEDPALAGEVEKKIRETVYSLTELVHGFEFAHLLTQYYEACRRDDQETKARIIQWFCGEYTTKTEARRDLGVGVIISDDSWYDYLKVFARFLKQAGYSGLFILIDELVNIYKIPQSLARQNNYEKILTMFNDTMQGKAHYLGIIMSGTPVCMEDPRRGVYSYEALKSRLASGRFSTEFKDMMAPVIYLQPLTPEEMLILTEKLRDIHSALYEYPTTVTEENLAQFIKLEYARVGADSHITPREIIRDFIELLDLVMQHPDKSICDFMASDSFVHARNEVESEPTDDSFAEFTV